MNYGGMLPRFAVALPNSLSLRAAVADELGFLYQVYAGTRTEELAVTGWDEAQKEEFLRMQFDAQHRYYHEVFAAASYQVILWDGERVGRLYIDRRADEIAIIDIALLPAWRGRGIGGILLREIGQEAERAGKPMRIYVEHFNRALTLYQRFGFRKIGDTGVYYHMEWSPPETA